MGLEREQAEVQQEEEDALKEPTAPACSSDTPQEFEVELQAALSALERQEPAHSPDEDKVHARTRCHATTS